jgi:hypothetical protein
MGLGRLECQLALQGKIQVVDIVVDVIVVLFLVLPALAIGGLFVWAAIKDGQADRALQARLGIRRRTRLGP